MENPKTIREIIKEKSDEFRFVEQLGPSKAEEELVKLSSLWASLNKEKVEARYWYNIKRQEIRKMAKSAADAKIEAEASKEWKDWQDREEISKALKDLISSVKYYIRGARDEKKEGVF